MAGKVFRDTTPIFVIDHGDIIEVGGKQYLVTGHERERRFGMDDPKFWVKRVVDAETGEKKIIKLSFLETFVASYGEVKVNCFRNPAKEAQILDLVRDHPYFMHGISSLDEKGNVLRILDIVNGTNFLLYLDEFTMPYREYMERYLPTILKHVVKAFEAIRFLHINGFRHGDIRNDHIIVEKETGRYVWIDFDYDFEATENPFALDLFGLGSILMNAIGKGLHDMHLIMQQKSSYGDVAERLEPGDFSIIHKRRLVNLKKLYPEIPKPLNDILMHFSKSANVYYEFTEEIIEDLNRCLYSVFE